MNRDMRQHMIDMLNDLLPEDERLVVLLAGISASRFTPHPRCINLGIMEQTLIGAAAGMAMEGFLPVAHTFAPFLVERPLEQLKDDFCYQHLGGNFISTGASYDYSEEGMTHQAPGDVQALLGLPGMQIIVPGTALEFERLFRQTYANDLPTYHRLALRSNSTEQPVEFGKLNVLRRGQAGTIIAVGPMLEPTLQASAGLDVTILYCTTVAPFDGETLRRECTGQRVALVEPYYAGGLVASVMAAMQHRPICLEAIGVPLKMLHNYGQPEQHEEALGLTPHGIRERLVAFLTA
ncbi:MAG TPA: transketolase C-terminal domain-containing protein [Ktedonobacteraceae bacterium]|nr:transketolase C-terminal domain-containing protein [Ktedonobacteraceae bacterium]